MKYDFDKVIDRNGTAAVKLEEAKEVWVEAVRTLAKAAGVRGMLGGQVIDLSCEGKPVDLETLNTLYELKTGALLRASARLGCLAGNAGEELLETAANGFHSG